MNKVATVNCQEPSPDRSRPGRREALCGAQLATSLGQRRIADDATLAAQASIIRLLDTQKLTPSLGIAVTSLDFLKDLAVIARHSAVGHRPSSQHGHTYRADAEQTARAVRVALNVLAANNLDEAAERLEALLPGRSMRSGGAHAALPGAWSDASQQLQNAVLQARDRHLRPADRLRFWTTTHAGPTLLLGVSRSTPDGRHRMVPQRLWPRWSVRLLPPAGVELKHLGPVLAACLLLPGNPISLRVAAQQLGGASSGPRISHTLRRVEATGHTEAVLAVLATLAEHLDAHGSPIDYQRRRQLFVTPDAHLLPRNTWRHLCDQAGLRAGPRNHLHAQRYLTEELTGQDIFSLPPPLRVDPGDDAVTYHRFCETMTPVLADLLAALAADILDRHRIAEPIWWEPPTEWSPPQVAWPGPDIDDLDPDALAGLLVEHRLRPGEAAARLGTSLDHVRLFLRRHPTWVDAPHRQPASTHSGDLVWTGPLSNARLRYEYEEHGLTWEQIARHAGRSKQTVRRLGQAAGIASRTPGRRPTLDIDRQWLETQYIQNRRTLPDIATELHVTPTTIARAARHLGLELRKRGGARQPKAPESTAKDSRDSRPPRS